MGFRERPVSVFVRVCVCFGLCRCVNVCVSRDPSVPAHLAMSLRPHDMSHCRGFKKDYARLRFAAPRPLLVNAGAARDMATLRDLVTEAGKSLLSACAPPCPSSTDANYPARACPRCPRKTIPSFVLSAQSALSDWRTRNTGRWHLWKSDVLAWIANSMSQSGAHTVFRELVYQGEILQFGPRIIMSPVWLALLMAVVVMCAVHACFLARVQ